MYTTQHLGVKPVDLGLGNEFKTGVVKDITLMKPLRLGIESKTTYSLIVKLLVVSQIETHRVVIESNLAHPGSTRFCYMI